MSRVQGSRATRKLFDRYAAAGCPPDRGALDRSARYERLSWPEGPRVLFLESVAPLNNVGAQALHFMQPIANAALDPERGAAPARYLERRGSVAWVVRELQREG